MTETPWMIGIEGALSAHFFQQDGSSGPGTDWKVGLKHRDEKYQIMVRSYMSPDLAKRFQKDTAYQAQTVMGYVNDLLQHGWHPSQPHPNLTITILNPKDMPPEKKAWWKFW